MLWNWKIWWKSTPSTIHAPKPIPSMMPDTINGAKLRGILNQPFNARCTSLQSGSSHKSDFFQRSVLLALYQPSAQLNRCSHPARLRLLLFPRMIAFASQLLTFLFHHNISGALARCPKSFYEGMYESPWLGIAKRVPLTNQPYPLLLPRWRRVYSFLLLSA